MHRGVVQLWLSHIISELSRSPIQRPGVLLCPVPPGPTGVHLLLIKAEQQGEGPLPGPSPLALVVLIVSYRAPLPSHNASLPRAAQSLGTAAD